MNNTCNKTRYRFYTRSLLLLRRPPCWNKHGAARTTQHVTSRHDSHDTSYFSYRHVMQQVEFGLIGHFKLRVNLFGTNRGHQVRWLDFREIIFVYSLKLVRETTGTLCCTGDQIREKQQKVRAFVRKSSQRTVNFR